MTGITGKTITYNKSDNITELYNLLPKIQSEFKRLDVKSGYYRDQEDINDISRDFILELIDKNWMKKVDLDKSNSPTPLLTYMRLPIRNYYSKHISKQIKFNEDSKTKVGLYKDSEEGNEILNPIVETNLTDNSYQNIHFCLDYPKLRKVFTRSLKGLERRCYKLFIKFNFTAREVAKAIGVSLRTAFNLKKSIIEKAKNCLESYYSPQFN